MVVIFPAFFSSLYLSSHLSPVFIFVALGLGVHIVLVQALYSLPVLSFSAYIHHCTALRCHGPCIWRKSVCIWNSMVLCVIFASASWFFWCLYRVGYHWTYLSLMLLESLLDDNEYILLDISSRDCRTRQSELIFLHQWRLNSLIHLLIHIRPLPWFSHR